jgi:hypothetical protein
MDEGTGLLPGFPVVAGKPVHIGFDGGRLNSDAKQETSSSSIYGCRAPVVLAGRRRA